MYKFMSKAELELIPDLERVIREPECFWMTGLPKSTRAFMEKKDSFQSIWCLALKSVPGGFLKCKNG